jgi:hypothetical protein
VSDVREVIADVKLTVDEMFARTQHERPAPIIDSKDGAGFDVAMMEAVIRPIVFRVRVRLGEAERFVEVLARLATS